MTDNLSPEAKRLAEEAIRQLIGCIDDPTYPAIQLGQEALNALASQAGPAEPDTGPGTVHWRFNALMDQLEDRFPDPAPYGASLPERRILVALDAALSSPAAEGQRVREEQIEAAFTRVDQLAELASQAGPVDLGECDECGTLYSFDPTDGGSICVACMKSKLARAQHDTASATPKAESQDAAVCEKVRCLGVTRELARMNDLLADYAKELKLNGDLSLARLIDGHRTMRERSLRSIDERNAELDKARDIARKAVLKSEYLSIEQLRSMTLGEIADFIAEN